MMTYLTTIIVISLDVVFGETKSWWKSNGNVRLRRKKNVTALRVKNKAMSKWYYKHTGCNLPKSQSYCQNKQSSSEAGDFNQTEIASISNA